MAAEDRIDPKLNAWLESPSSSESPSPSTPRDSGITSRSARAGSRSSAAIQALAERLGKSEQEITEHIESDTIRRTKYPVLTVRNPDGTLSFKEPTQVIEGGRKSLLAIDRGEGGVVRPEQPRDTSGKFTK